MSSSRFSSPNQPQDPRHQHVAPSKKKTRHTSRQTHPYTAVCNNKIIIKLTSSNSFPRKIWGKTSASNHHHPLIQPPRNCQSLVASCASLVQARQCRNNAFQVSPEECPNDIKQSTNQPTWLPWTFKTPNIWVITSKNEGCGFPWYPVILRILVFLSSSFSRKILPIIIGILPKMWYKVGLDSSVRVGVVGPITPFIGVTGNPELPIL